jgi:threonine synthase
VSVTWTEGITLRCTECGATREPGLHWFGCAECGAPLEVIYPPGTDPALPIPAAARTDLAARPTPLLRLASDPLTLLKLELHNPTGSHKDRFHAVTSGIARMAGAPGIVTTSTGNHGVSCAAHAARDGLPCVVLSTQALPRALAFQIAAHGAKLVRLDAAGRRAALVELVERGWVPATSSDPALTGAGNPYGAEGYRAIADEVLDELGSLPDVVFVPVASGDTILGVARGFASAARRLDREPPTIVSCQPAGAATISTSLAAGRPVTLERPESIARSTADAASGRLAIETVRHGGLALTVPDAAIAEATRDLAERGLYVETSSALALAGARAARAQGLVAADALGVALLTAGGRGWSEDADGVFPAPRWIDDREELQRALVAAADQDDAFSRS